MWRGLLRNFLSLLAFKVVTRGSRFLNFSMATLERTNLGGANMRIMRGGHSWQLGSIAFLARETTGGEILVAVWPGQTCPQKRSQSA